MKTYNIELPAEFHSGNSIPVERATITRERMTEILQDALEADRKRRGEPVAKIDPNPPQLSIVWHDSPESIDRAMWEQAAIEAGVSYEDLIEGSNVGETEDGEVFEFTHEQVIEGMRVQGCWGFVDTGANIINAWAAPDADPEFVINMLAHEIGHVTGDPHDDDIQEEMRAEQFGQVAALAYKLWIERDEATPQPADPDDPNTSPRSGKGPFESASDLINSINEPVKVPSDDDIEQLAKQFGFHRVPGTIELARALLARYGQPVEPEGWQLVPKEPTKEMLAATSWPNCAGTDYKHMLEAAPKFGGEEE